jgi:hypothetical protein
MRWSSPRSGHVAHMRGYEDAALRRSGTSPIGWPPDARHLLRAAGRERHPTGATASEQQARSIQCSDESESDEAVAIDGSIGITEGSAGELPEKEPGSSSENATLAFRRSCWINLSPIVTAIPVARPLPDIPEHVVKPPSIRLLSGNRVRPR